MKNNLSALLVTDSNGSVYLKQASSGEITLFYSDSGFEILKILPLLNGVEIAEINPLEVLMPDCLCMSLQDAVNMIENERIEDILTIAALLKAEYFKLIKAKTPVLYQDEYCIAVNKPHGLLVHRTSMSSDKDFLLQRVRDQSGKKVYPVHRLDRPTSGVVLFAFSKEIVAEFFKLFREREAKKTYLALVRGWTDDSGVIDSPLKTDSGKEQDALTLYKTIAKTEVDIPVGPYEKARYSLVEIDLKTGRTHQIRRHFAHLRHPLIGDTTHGDGRHNQMFRSKFNTHRLMLAATKLELLHPFTQKELKVEAPLETGFKTVLVKLGVEEFV
jgi:tRNA pseudouridine65 synthase